MTNYFIPARSVIMPGFLLFLTCLGFAQETRTMHPVELICDKGKNSMHLHFRESQRNYVFLPGNRNYRHIKRKIERAIHGDETLIVSAIGSGDTIKSISGAGKR